MSHAVKKIAYFCIFCLLLPLAACQREEAVFDVVDLSDAAKVAVPGATPTLFIRIEPTPWVAPTPEPDALSVPEGCYTIAWMSDTQYYCENFPETFHAMTLFLANQAKRIGLGYVVHTGDLVQSYKDETQWAVADAAMASIAHIPHGVLAGNHDSNAGKDYNYFRKYFGESRFAGSAWYGGSYANSRGHYDLLTLGDTDYLFVYMGYGFDAAGIAWLNGVFSRYPDRVGILCVHDYFTTGLQLSDAGQQLYEVVVAKNHNLYMVLCGHRYAQACIPAYFDDNGDGAYDRTVYQLMQNYQVAGSEGGSGYMRFLQIDEAADEIRVYSYSPLLDDYKYYDTAAAQTEKYASDSAVEAYTLQIPW